MSPTAKTAGSSVLEVLVDHDGTMVERDTGAGEVLRRRVHADADDREPRLDAPPFTGRRVAEAAVAMELGDNVAEHELDARSRYSCSSEVDSSGWPSAAKSRSAGLDHRHLEADAP